MEKIDSGEGKLACICCVIRLEWSVVEGRILWLAGQSAYNDKREVF